MIVLTQKLPEYRAVVKMVPIEEKKEITPKDEEPMKAGNWIIPLWIGVSLLAVVFHVI